MPMFFEFIEVLLGANPCGKTSDEETGETQEFDVDVRPGSLATATQDSGVAEGEAVAEPEEAPAVEEPEANTEVEGLEFTQLPDPILEPERAEENTEEREAEEEEEEPEEESEEEADLRPDPKMVECLRGLHKRDAYIRKEHVTKVKNSMEKERKKGQQRIKNIFELHKKGGKPQAQERSDTAEKRAGARSERRLNYFGGAASVHGSVYGQ